MLSLLKNSTDRQATKKSHINKDSKKVPQPKELAEQLQDQVKQYVAQLEKTGEVDEDAYNSLRALCDRVAKTDVCRADSRRALLASLSGKTEHYEAAIKNLKANNFHDKATLEEFAHLVNHGYVLQAFEMRNTVIQARHAPNTSSVLPPLTAAGAYKTIHQLVTSAPDRSEVMALDTLILEVRKVVEVMNQLGIDDSAIARMQDVAGELFREKKRTWAGARPHATALAQEEDGPLILIEYYVGVSPTEAAEMSWDLAKRLVERELDVPGVTISFTGMGV
ncbi:hypothetical protein [Comamonas jiangduensis]|uniref:hypothetical protein n=1 Tax=Comamonas jiangduensis TaxID=1194168 RepID=UPI0028A64770|nr:hypothetical protein [Comamonas jiangduensis]